MATEKAKRDYVTECLSMRMMKTPALIMLFGRDDKGRPKRIAQRMRRAGVALSRDAALETACRGLPLRDILSMAEKAMKGKEYAYT